MIWRASASGSAAVTAHELRLLVYIFVLRAVLRYVAVGLLILGVWMLL